MSDAVISNRIYLKCLEGSLLDKELKDILTYKIPQEPKSPYPLVINNVIRITDNIVSIPSGRVDLIPENYTVVNKQVSKNIELPEPRFVPRPSQQAAIDFINGNGIINAPPGWGKTVAALGIIHKLKQKTLIITPTTTIRDMWIGEVKKWVGITPGVIGGGKFDIDSPIVVGNIQTIRNRTSEISGEFGLLICDEVHRAPAKTFSNVINMSKAKIKLGLSATLGRKDGTHVVIPDYFGREVFVADQENTIDPEVHLWDVDVAISNNAFIPWADKVTELVNNQLYKDSIVALANSYANAGHKVLILSDRVSLLEYGHLQTKDRSLIVTGEVTGEAVRQKIFEQVADPSSDADMLWGTQVIFSEGVSINQLSCLILGAPVSNNSYLLEQLAGRVMRVHSGKKTPIICDIAPSGSTAQNQANSRKEFYISKGWKIRNMGNVVAYSE